MRAYLGVEVDIILRRARAAVAERENMVRQGPDGASETGAEL